MTSCQDFWIDSRITTTDPATGEAGGAMATLSSPRFDFSMSAGRPVLMAVKFSGRPSRSWKEKSAAVRRSRTM
jgi:hypothetical protein